MEEQPLKNSSLLSKLLEVMKEIGYIEKRGVNTYHGYNYVMEADVLAALRDKLTAQRIFVITSVVDGKRTEVEGTKGKTFLFDVTLEHRVFCADSGECIVVRSMGSGIDNQDKSIYKAITGAIKYFFTKNFLIPTDADPEDDHGAVPDVPKGSVPKSDTGKKITKASEIPKDKPAPKVHSELFSKWLDYMKHEKKRVGDEGYYSVLKDFGITHANEVGEGDQLLQEGIYYQLKAMYPESTMGPVAIEQAKQKAADFIKQIVARDRS